MKLVSTGCLPGTKMSTDFNPTTALAKMGLGEKKIAVLTRD